VITLIAPAKINLYLHVMGVREDGYHLLDSMAIFLHDLHDTLTVEKIDKLQFLATGLVPKGADGENNLAVKAAIALARQAGIKPHVRIRLEKTIPAGAGLGGGSADAATVVKAMEQLWNLSLQPEDREKLLLSLGADVPLCYHGEPCRFEGIGEIISDIPPLPHFSVLLVWPDVHTSTKDVFENSALAFRKTRIEIPSSFANLRDFVDFLQTTGNDLQQAAEKISPAILAARLFLEMKEGCLLTRMSGSGSCMFGIFEDRALCAAAQAQIHAKFPAWWTHTGIV
jgi:4-diphosphocytidyl-2-C-methyl-D-erythritol kinase